MADLLNDLGKKQETQPKPEKISEQNSGGETLAGNESNTAGVNTGDNLIDKVSEVSEENTESDSKTQFKEPETWTLESAAMEVKKAREEAKARRLQLKETEAQFQERFNELQKKTNAKIEKALEAQKELETLKAKEQDKKRSIEEKLAHREAMLAERDAKLDAIQQDYESKMKELTSQLNDFQAEREATLKVYKEKINEELDNVSEKKRKFAEALVKGYEDPRDAWTALSEAKLAGLFEEKQVVVSHATPGADASRMTKEKLEAAKAESRKNLKSSDLVREGLQQIASEKGNLRGKIV